MYMKFYIIGKVFQLFLELFFFQMYFFSYLHVLKNIHWVKLSLFAHVCIWYNLLGHEKLICYYTREKKKWFSLS